MILSGRDNECKEQQESKHVEDKAGTENSRALEKGKNNQEADNTGSSICSSAKGSSQHT